MRTRDEFLKLYGFELATYEHPKIAELLFYNGRSIITGTNGICSVVGGDPFLGQESTILMKVLWLIKNSGENPLTYKHMSHYLGHKEVSILRRIGYAKTSIEFTKRAEILRNGHVKVKCIDPNLFPDNNDVNGFRELSNLIRSTFDHSLMFHQRKPPMTASNRYDSLFLTVLDWIRHCDGEPLQTKSKSKRTIDDKEYGITIEEIAENTGWKSKKIKDEIRRLEQTTLKNYIRYNVVNGVNRYFMLPEGRNHTLNQLRAMAIQTWDNGRLPDKVKCSTVFDVENNTQFKRIPVNL